MNFTYAQYQESADFLRTKLGACGDYIRTVRGVGYRMEELK